MSTKIDLLDENKSPFISQVPIKKEVSGTLKSISLTLLTLQNAALFLVMRYVRTRPGDMFMSTSAVIMGEVFKLFSCLTILLWQAGFSLPLMLVSLKQNTIDQPLDCLKIAVPSIVYTLQNNLLYIGASNLDAATAQVTYQLKILTTALLSVVMLKKKLSRAQWFALVLLFVGVSAVQLTSQEKSAAAEDRVQRPLVGLMAVITACFMSAFAGVYFEKILKGTSQTIWVRNVQLAVIGIVIGTITMLLNDGSTLFNKGFFFGYDLWVWLVISLSSVGGLVVAAVVKYADNILKGFATSASIIISCIVSVILFDFKLTEVFALGTLLVIISVYIYGKYVPKPDTKIESQNNQK